MAVSNKAPFTPKVRIYPGGDPADASTWQQYAVDVSQYVRYPGSDGGQPISYSGGSPDEATRVDPSRMDLTFDNRDGRFCPANFLGPWYGKLKRGTPITMGTVSGEDAFARTVSGALGTNPAGQTWAAGTSWSVNGSAATSTINANIISAATLSGAEFMNGEARLTVSLNQVPTGSSCWAGLMIHSNVVADSILITAEFAPGGTMFARAWQRTPAQLFTLGGAGPVLSYTAGTKVRIYVQVDAAALRVKVWKPANPATPDADEPAAWSTIITTSIVPGAKTGIIAWRDSGSTNTGLVFSYNDFLAEANEFTGTLAQLPVEWDMSGNNSWAAVSAQGVTRRLIQGTGALRSPLLRQLSAYSPTGYWPLEDGPQASQFGSAINGGLPADKSGSTVQPSGDSSLTGGGPAPIFLNGQASVRGQARRNQTGTGFSGMFFFKLSALPAAKTRLVQWRGPGRIVTWNLYVNETGSIATEGIETDGTVTVDTLTITAGYVDLTKWTAVQLETDWNSGTSTISWAMIFHQVGDPLYYSQSGTYTSGSPSRINWFQLGSGLSDLNGAAFAHMWMGENTLPFVAQTFSLVSDGYRGETDIDRLTRVAGDSKIPLMIENRASAVGQQLGPQRPGTFLDVAQDCEDAGYGILYEFGSGFAYRARNLRYNRATGMSISRAAGQIGDVPRGIDDDQRLRNDWTVSRQDGSYAQVTDESSIALNGRYDDSATINVYKDSVLVHHAGWRVYLGTRSDLRWPTIPLNFARAPELLPSWRARTYGMRVKVTTGKSQIGDAEPDVFAEGYSATLWPHGWTVSLSCAPAAPWDAPLAGATDARGAVTPGASTVAAASASAPSLAVTAATTADRWSTQVPYDLNIAGERVTVTAITGAGLTQTMTVTRGVNGGSKAIVAGTPVQIWRPMYGVL